jgi:hypothetical protein
MLCEDASMVEIVSKGGLGIVVESMKRFNSSALVQAAGCWFIAIISGKNGKVTQAAYRSASVLSVWFRDVQRR